MKAASKLSARAKAGLVVLLVLLLVFAFVAWENWNIRPAHAGTISSTKRPTALCPLHTRNETVSLYVTGAATGDRNLFMAGQHVTWRFFCVGAFNDGPPVFQPIHWVNNAPDIWWQFVKDYPPITTHGTDGGYCPCLPWIKRVQTALFKLCVIPNIACKTDEVTVWQKVYPVLAASGGYGQGGHN